MKKANLLCLVILLCCTSLFSKTYETISQGYWDNESVWLGGEVPETTSNDTFLILHPLFVSEDLTFENGADILIEEDGGLCGHQKLNMFSGSKLVSYGVVEFDTLNASGGEVSCFGGFFILSSFATITNGGSVAVIGASLQVGPWFECIEPTYSFLMTSSEVTPIDPPASLTIFPNPTDGYFSIQGMEGDETVEILDIAGRVMGYNGMEDGTISLNGPAGIYIVKVMTPEGKLRIGRVVKD